MSIDRIRNASEFSLEIKRFQEAPIKVAIQKSGHLTDISRHLLSEALEIENIPEPSSDRLVVSTTPDHQIGFFYAKTADLPRLVANFTVNLAVVGNYQLIEGWYESLVSVIQSYEDRYQWPLVLATSRSGNIHNAKEIKKIATHYPQMTNRFLSKMHMPNIQLIYSQGGTEIMPYASHNGWGVDAIVDLVSTGQTLREYDLIPWYPPVGQVFPVLIGDRGFR